MGNSPAHLLLTLFLLLAFAQLSASQVTQLFDISGGPIAPIAATQCIIARGVGLNCTAPPYCNMTISNTRASFDAWNLGTTIKTITSMNATSGPCTGTLACVTDYALICGKQVGTFTVNITNNTMSSGPSSTVTVNYAPKPISPAYIYISSPLPPGPLSVTARDLFNVSVTVLDLAGNAYSSTSYSNFFYSTSTTDTFGQVVANQTVEYYRKGDNVVKSVTLNTASCTYTSLTYNTTGYCAVGTSPPKADCFCTWFYTTTDLGTHIFRLPTYDVIVPPLIISNSCGATALAAETQCTTPLPTGLGGLRCDPPVQNTAICGSSTTWYCPCLIVESVPQKVKRISTTFTSAWNISAVAPPGYSRTIIVNVNPLPQVESFFSVLTPNSAEAKVPFTIDIGAYDSVGDLVTGYSKAVYINASEITGATGFTLTPVSGCTTVDLTTVSCTLSLGKGQFSLSIDVPGNYQFRVSNITAAGGAEGYAGIQITGPPTKITLAAPTIARQNIPFSVRAYIQDDLGRIVTGYDYQLNLSLSPPPPAPGPATIAAGGVAGDFAICTINPMFGYCDATINPVSPTAPNTVTLTAKCHDGTCTLTDGTATFTIYESLCNTTVVIPPVPPAAPLSNNILSNTIYPPVDAVNATNYKVGNYLIGWDSATNKMLGNQTICSYGYGQMSVKMCVNSTDGEFEGQPGLFCLKQFAFSPQVDGDISDHFGFNSSNLSMEKMRETFYYPKLLWGWGFTGVGSANVLSTECGGGYKYNITLSPNPPDIKALFFNLSVVMTSNMSLATFNMTNKSIIPGGSNEHPLNPYEIKGLEAIYTTEPGFFKRYASTGGSPLETMSDGITDPRGMTIDRRGNIFVTDAQNKCVYVYKAARSDTGKSTFYIRRIPASGSLTVDTLAVAGDGDTVAYKGEYTPYGVAVDSYNKLYIIGFSNPGGMGGCSLFPRYSECNKLIIQVLNPEDDSTSITHARIAPIVVGTLKKTNYAVKRETADIAVSPRGDKIYVADSNKTLLILSSNGTAMKLLKRSNLYIPCRHIGSGCWDNNCRDLGSKQYMGMQNMDEDSCRWTGDDVDVSDKYLDTSVCNSMLPCNYWGVCKGGTICHSTNYLFSPEHDSQDQYHQAVSVFYKRGFIFVVDRFQFERKEGYGDKTLGIGCTEGGRCSGDGVACLTSGFWYVRYHTYYEAAHDATFGIIACNYCGCAAWKHRTENWIRVYWEDDSGALNPVLHMVIKSTVKDVDLYTDYTGTANEPLNSFRGKGPYLWGSMTTNYDYSSDGTMYTHYVGWNYTAQSSNTGPGMFGSAYKLNISDQDNARIDGIFVDEYMNIYFPVRGLTGTDVSYNGVYKVAGPMASSSAGPVSLARLINITSDPGMGAQADAVAYPDLILQTLTQGIYCEGCNDKAGIDLDVCEQEQAKAARGEGEAMGRSSAEQGESFGRIYINTSITGQILVTYTATIQKVSCATGAALELPTFNAPIRGYATATTPVLQAYAEGGLFALVFQRPYRLSQSAAPQVLPNVDYVAYSSRLLTKHFVVIDQIKGKPAGEQLMANSSYRFNYTRWNNSYYGYEFITSNVSIYENVSPAGLATQLHYDQDAQPFFNTLYLPNPYWAGFDNVSLDWPFPKAYNFEPLMYIANGMPLTIGPNYLTPQLVACASKRGEPGTAVQLQLAVTGFDTSGTERTEYFIVNKSCGAVLADWNYGDSYNPATIVERCGDCLATDTANLGSCTPSSTVCNCRECKENCVKCDASTPPECNDFDSNCPSGTTETACTGQEKFDIGCVTDPSSFYCKNGAWGSCNHHWNCCNGVTCNCPFDIVNPCDWDRMGSQAETGEYCGKPCHKCVAAASWTCQQTTCSSGTIKDGPQTPCSTGGCTDTRLTYSTRTPTSTVAPLCPAGYSDTLLPCADYSSLSCNKCQEGVASADYYWRVITGVTVSGGVWDADVKIHEINSSSAALQIEFTLLPVEGARFDTTANALRAYYPYYSAGSIYATPTGSEMLIPANPFPPEGTELAVTPRKASNITTLVIVGKNVPDPIDGYVEPIQGYATVTGATTGGAFYPDMPEYPVVPEDPFKNKYTGIVTVRGTNAEFGDEFEVVRDSALVSMVTGSVVLSGSTTTATIDAPPLILPASAGETKISVSSKRTVCCNHTIRNYTMKVIDICKDNKEDAESNCTELYELGNCAGEVKPDPNKCASGEWLCACMHSALDTELLYTDIHMGLTPETCAMCSDRTNPDCQYAAGSFNDLCLTTSYYTLDSSTATVEVIGLAGGKLQSDSHTFGGTGQLASLPKNNAWSAIYKLKITNGANETIQFFNSDTGSPISSIFVGDNNSLSKSNNIAILLPEDRRVRIFSNKTSSNAQVRIFGVNNVDAIGYADGELVPFSGASQADTAGEYREVYRVEITDAQDELISLNTTPLINRPPQTYGIIRVEPNQFQPSPLKNASGIFYFASNEHVSLSVVDEKVLGYHKLNWTFYDRFKNAFIWEQPFDFKLPTKILLTVGSERDSTDANRTRVEVSARLLFQRIGEPDKPPSNPLASDPLDPDNTGYIVFYEYKVVTDVNKRPTNTPAFIREWNAGPDYEADSTIPCTCWEEACYIGEGESRYLTTCMVCYTKEYISPAVPGPSETILQQPCHETAVCTNGAQCMNRRKCTDEFDCGFGGICEPVLENGLNMQYCRNSGRCLRSFGFLANKTTDVDGRASYEYEVCGWGRHRIIALFDPPPTSKYAKSLAIEAYYSGGFPLSVGELSLVLPLALILLALLGKLFYDGRNRKAIRGGTHAS